MSEPFDPEHTVATYRQDNADGAVSCPLNAAVPPAVAPTARRSYAENSRRDGLQLHSRNAYQLAHAQQATVTAASCFRGP